MAGHLVTLEVETAWMLMRSHRTELFELEQLLTGYSLEMAAFSVMKLKGESVVLLLRSPQTEILQSVESHSQEVAGHLVATLLGRNCLFTVEVSKTQGPSSW